jgi:type IV secretion system protein VirB11
MKDKVRTESGKSTFTNAVLKKMVEYTPSDRFYIVDDMPELQCGAKDKSTIVVNLRHAAEAVRTARRWTPGSDCLRGGAVRGSVQRAYGRPFTGGNQENHPRLLLTIHLQ